MNPSGVIPFELRSRWTILKLYLSDSPKIAAPVSLRQFFWKITLEKCSFVSKIFPITCALSTPRAHSRRQSYLFTDSFLIFSINFTAWSGMYSTDISLHFAWKRSRIKSTLRLRTASLFYISSSISFGGMLLRTSKSDYFAICGFGIPFLLNGLLYALKFIRLLSEDTWLIGRFKIPPD